MKLLSFFKNLFKNKKAIEVPITIAPEIVEQKKVKRATKKMSSLEDSKVTIEKKKRPPKKSES